MSMYIIYRNEQLTCPVTADLHLNCQLERPSPTLSPPAAVSTHLRVFFIVWVFSDDERLTDGEQKPPCAFKASWKCQRGFTLYLSSTLRQPDILTTAQMSSSRQRCFSPHRHTEQFAGKRRLVSPSPGDCERNTPDSPDEFGSEKIQKHFTK